MNTVITNNTVKVDDEYLIAFKTKEDFDKGLMILNKTGNMSDALFDLYTNGIVDYDIYTIVKMRNIINDIKQAIEEVTMVIKGEK